MSSIDYESIQNKARIVVEFIQGYFSDEEYDEFFDYNDLGIPLSVMLVNNLVTPTEEGAWLFYETYNSLCDLFGANPAEDYTDLQDLMGEQL